MEWISVKDRLPELPPLYKRELYLVCANGIVTARFYEQEMIR